MNEPMNTSGQVLAEAVVVMLVLIALLLGVHWSGRWQYEWQRQWQIVQTGADAAAADHQALPDSVRQSQHDPDASRSWVMDQYRIGENAWFRFESNGQFAQQAWRPLGAGYASADLAVERRLASAPKLWREPATHSLRAVSPLLPTILAVEMPWNRAGDPTDWLTRWRGSTPSAYLKSTGVEAIDQTGIWASAWEATKWFLQ